MGTEKNLVSKSAFAKMCGVSPAAITKACRGELGEAVSAKKIDANHAAAKKYAKSKGAKITKLKPAGPRGRASVNQKREEKLKVDGYYSKTLLEIVQIHGSQAEFEGWLRTAKLMEEIRERQTKNFEREKELVPRELVKQTFIEPYDAAHKALLGGVSKTIAAKALSMAKSGATQQKIERFVSETISKTLKHATKNSLKTLDKATKK